MTVLALLGLVLIAVLVAVLAMLVGMATRSRAAAALGAQRQRPLLNSEGRASSGRQVSRS